MGRLGAEPTNHGAEQLSLYSKRALPTVAHNMNEPRPITEVSQYRISHTKTENALAGSL